MSLFLDISTWGGGAPRQQLSPRLTKPFSNNSKAVEEEWNATKTVNIKYAMSKIVANFMFGALTPFDALVLDILCMFV